MNIVNTSMFNYKIHFATIILHPNSYELPKKYRIRCSNIFMHQATCLWQIIKLAIKVNVIGISAFKTIPDFSAADLKCWYVSQNAMIYFLKMQKGKT